MEMANQKRFFLAVILVLGFALIAFPTSSIWGADKPEKFTIYQSHDLSGPMGPLMVAAIPGSHDFCNWFNKTKGGIKGVPVESVLRDNAGKVGDGVSAYEEFRLVKPKPAIVLITPTFVAQSIMDRAYEDGIVEFFCGGSNSALFPVKMNIGFAPSYAGACAGSLAWARENWKGPTMKVGLLTWDNGYGKGIFDDQLRKWVKNQKGIELVGEEVFKPRDVDVTTQVIRLKNKGANWIVDNTLGSGPILVSKAIKNLGLLSQDINDTTPGKIHRATGDWGMSKDVVRLGGGPGGLTEGIIGPRHVASFSEKDNPGIKLIMESLKNNNRGENIMTLYYVHIWAKLNVTCHAVEKVVEKYGWEGLTGKRVWDELSNLKHFDSLGLADVTYSPDYPILGRCKMYGVKNGEILPVSDYMDLPDMTPASARK
jgi:branched-chain amino acid transport system substrate-binding protein